jgi:dinuclear metal center YbgI/SA1388 family protein
MANLQDLEHSFEALWPTEQADSWDAPGFALSMPGEVKNVLLSVDLTGAVLAEAIAKDCQVVVTHHPFLLKPLHDVNWDSLKGSLLQKAIKANVSLFAAHTNADVALGGVSDVLAKAFGLIDLAPLEAAEGQASIGHGRVGHLKHEISLRDFAISVAEALPFTARGVAVAGNPDQLISTVALCGGAGDAFIQAAVNAGADVYVTSDLRHHVTLDAISVPRHEPFAMIEISHWAAESLWVRSAQKQLSDAVADVAFLVSEVVTDPWSFSINRGTE